MSDLPRSTTCPFWSDGQHLFETIMRATTNYTYAVELYRHYTQNGDEYYRTKRCQCGFFVIASMPIEA